MAAALRDLRAAKVWRSMVQAAKPHSPVSDILQLDDLTQVTEIPCISVKVG